jgi:hypothetical protein
MSSARSRYENEISDRDKYPNRRSILSKPSPSTSTNRRSCSYFLLCREYLFSLSWPKLYFNSHQDRCYCSQCYSKNKCDSYLIANSPYVIPRGWVRFGLYVDSVKAQVENIWETWHNTYHGTDSQCALSVISHGQFLLSGDTCESGRQLNGRCPYLYTSPTIKYSSRRAYAKPENFVALNGKHFTAQIVLQCKQKPGTYKVQGATGRARFEEKLCDVIPNDQIEFYTEIRASVVPYGVTVRLVPVDE